MHPASIDFENTHRENRFYIHRNAFSKLAVPSPKKKISIHFRLAVTLLLLLININIIAQNPIPPIGEWREHLNYQNTIQVVSGDKIYCATTNNLFSVDNQGAIERFSKVTGLNDIGVQTIGWDELTQQLVIAYANSNIDLLSKDGSIKNIGDIKRSSIPGNKTINRIYCNNGLAYLCSGLGIIVANLTRNEIKDTWIIGNNASSISINGFAVDGNNYYAGTDEGLKSISILNPTPSNFANWQNLSGIAGLSGGVINNIIISNNQLIVQKSDSLFIKNGSSWQLLYTDNGWGIINMTASENKIIVCERTPSGNAKVVVLNNNGIIEKTIAQSGVISLPRSATLVNSALWVADQFGGLASFNPTLTRYIPNGPPGAATGEMVAGKDLLAVAAGSVNSSWNYQYNRNGVYLFQNDTWRYIGYYNTPILDSVLDFITIAIDPTNQSIWAGSYGGGLVNIPASGNPVIYKKNNSSLQAAIGDPGSIRVSGLAFDQQQQLWISNYGAPQNLQVRKTDGSFKAFSIPFNHLENAVSQIIVDDLNQLWILSPKNNGLFCFNYGKNVDVLSDDQWKFYQQGAGNGNLPSNNVLSIAKDKSGFIWVGTDKGIGIIRCLSGIFSSTSCDASLPIIQQGQFAGLLFKDESVQSIAVDGADRKWIGTKNGVWLVSPQGDKIIYRFTAENSPLLGNDINHITIDPVTGEAFISTNYGICSFRSTATTGQSINNEALVFPNPVPPGYNGTIAMRGLAENSLVKITELNGRLIYQTRSLGGQAIWDGHNYLGQKVNTGIYLVIIRDDNNTEKIVTKIVFVSGK
jgi:hypothetical protein